MASNPSAPRLSFAWADIPVRVVLGLVFAFSAGAYFKNAFEKITAAQGAAAETVSGLSILAIGLYTFLVACAYALRLKPVNRAGGLLPFAAALLGGFLICGLLFIGPRANLSLTAQIAAAVLILIGNGFAVYALTHLGRSFSILPESRRLVTGGPYKYVRHPLYLAEAVATVGILIDFFSPVAAALVAVQLVSQLVRIAYEEKTLQASFPEYANYAKRTARLIPGVY